MAKQTPVIRFIALKSEMRLLNTVITKNEFLFSAISAKN
jgi:hypothetical protein